MTETKTGSIKFFRWQGGWGFITQDDSSADLFFHESGLCAGYDPERGDAVTYVLGKDRDGRVLAKEVRKA